MQTVQELEQKILAGQIVTPDEMAAALTADNAAKRIAELTSERERTQKEAAALADAKEQLTGFESKLSQLIAADAEGVQILARVSAAAADFQSFVANRNKKLEALRTDARRLAPFASATAITVDVAADGFTQIGEAATTIRNWKNEVEMTFTNSLNQVAQATQRY